MLVRSEQQERPRGRRGAAIIAGVGAAILVLGLVLVALLPFTDGGICIGNGPFWLRGYHASKMMISAPPGFQSSESPVTRVYTLGVGDLAWQLILLK